MNNHSHVENRLCRLAADAKRDLAWLAAIHVITKSRQQDILPQAAQLLITPESHLGVQNLPPAAAKRERAKAIEAFQTFCDSATEPPAQDPGHYLNKSAILYADAILQAFLDKSYETVASNKKLAQKELTKASIGGKLQEISSLVPKSSFKTAKHVKFLSQLRHIITHNNGYVDEKFLKNCGIDYPNLTLPPNKDPLWDTKIWPDEKKFLESYKPPDSGKQFQAKLSIDGVIIPYLKHSIEFIEKFLEELLKATK
jgi:hypothetical protein